MKKTIITLLLVITAQIGFSQNNTIAKIKYEEAEQAYVNNDYKLTISKLDEAEALLKSTNPKILHLKISAQFNLIEQDPLSDYAFIESTRKSSANYLKDYEDIPNNEEKYREIYFLNENLKKYPSNSSDFEVYKKQQEIINAENELHDEAYKAFEMGDLDKYERLILQFIAKDPTNPVLYYNLGVAASQGKKENAIDYYKKAIELKPDFADAYINIGNIIIEKANSIIEEMNKSLSNYKKYDKLQFQQFDIYREALPWYEKAYAIDGKNISVIQTLMSLYEKLEMTDKLNKIKVVYAGLNQ